MNEETDMAKSIVRDIFFLHQKSELVTEADINVAKDLLDTLQALAEHTK